MNLKSGPQALSTLPVKLAGIFAFITFFSLLSGMLVFNGLRDAMREEVQRNINTVGVLKTAEIQDWLDDRYADARTLTGNSFFSREAAAWLRTGRHNQQQRREIESRLRSFIEQHHFRSVLMFDQQGKVVIQAGLPIQDEPDMSAYARLAMSSWQTMLVDLHRHADAEFPVGLGIMSPLHEGDGYFGALYFAEDPARYLFPLIERWPVESKTAETQLIRAENGGALFLNHLRFRDAPPLTYRADGQVSLQAAIEAVRGKRGLLEHAHDYRDEPVLSYVSEIPGTPWLLIAKIDEDEAYSLIDRIRWIASGMALLIFGLGGAWFLQTWRRAQLAREAVLLEAQVRADKVQMENDQRFRAVFEHTALAMSRNSLQGGFLEVNDAWCALFGYAREEVYADNLNWKNITHPEDVQESINRVQAMLVDGRDRIALEKRYLRKDGKTIWGSLELSLVRDEAGKPQYFIVAVQDITERKLAEQQISFLAYHDKLTGLPNRALFFDRLSQALSQARRNSKHVALCYLDLDGFKPVNDEFGHDAGDAILKMVAQRLLACVRGVDTVARLGGDEFVVLLGGLDRPQEAENIATKVQQAFNQPMMLANGIERTIGISMGISVFPDDGGEIDRLLAAADLAMYQSKREGKSSYCFYSEIASTADAGEQWMVFDQTHMIGVAKVDEEHRNLVHLLNRLNLAFRRGEAHAVIEGMFDDLLTATVQHFRTEAALMEQYQYAASEAHLREHDNLVREALYLKDHLKEGGELLALQSVKDWLIGHIKHSDKLLGAYLNSRGVY